MTSFHLDAFIAAGGKDNATEPQEKTEQMLMDR